MAGKIDGSGEKSGATGRQTLVAEEYDTYKDRRLEEGTWRNRKRRGPSLPALKSEPKPYKNKPFEGGKLELPTVTFFSYREKKDVPAALHIQGLLTQNGEVILRATLPYNAKEMQPDLKMLAEKTAKKLKHVKYGKISHGSAMELSAFYRLPKALPPTKYNHASEPARDERAALQDFKKLLLKHLASRGKKQAMNKQARISALQARISALQTKVGGLDPVSLGEMMASAARQFRHLSKPLGNLRPYLGVYEEVGTNLIRLGHTVDEEERKFLKSEIDTGMKYLRKRGREIQMGAKALGTLADSFDLVAKSIKRI